MTGTQVDAESPTWSVIVPFYNERKFIAGTIRSAMAQAGVRLRLILVDNASNDDTAALCREILVDAPELDVCHFHEARPGHLFALDRGWQAVTTPYVAFWDADTVYPPHYLAEAERLLASGRHAAAQAIDVYVEPLSPAGRLRRVRMRVTQMLLARQGHVGSYGQCFRTESLRAAGGPMSPHWGYVLYDHELMHRVYKVGSATGSRALWCLPSPRRGASAHVRWTLFERILYHIVPFRLKDWFFYRFLADRFAARGMVQQNLRIRDWEASDDSSH